MTKQWGPLVVTRHPAFTTVALVLVLPFTGKRWSVQVLFVRMK